ncbi:hypothetical protein SUGI_1091080 [Cryptomeria japonica]|nr:hypothetical protein SUGI_1091080 [Cryptomeria japonica]
MEAVFYNNEPTQYSCRTGCLKNCSCTAFAFAISDPPVCRLWFGDLLRVRVSPEGQSVFVRLAASELPHLTSHQSNKTSRLFLSLPTTFSIVLVLFFASFLLWKNQRLREESVEEDVPITLKMFTYKELRIATENFKHKLGSRGFGSVFK